MTQALTLRPAQARVLAYTGGPLAISAVPGAGKTFTLTQLAAKLIAEDGVDPAQILILTYMRSAAREFKRRIAQALATRGRTAYGLQAMTIHAFCLAVVRDATGPAAEDVERLTVLSEPERVRMMMDGLELYLAQPGALAGWRARYGEADGDRWADPKQATYRAALKALAAAKSRGLGVEAVEAILGPRQPELAFLVRHYETQRARFGTLDFDDLVGRAIATLRRDEALRAHHQRRWRWVLEDEAQDSTPTQHELLQLLVDPAWGGSGNLVRVGDGNQAILTSFTFNDPRFFRAFCEELGPAGRHVAMDESSRSAPEVLALANHLVAHVQAHHPDVEVQRAFQRLDIRPATAGKPNPQATAPPSWTVYESKDEERAGVLMHVRELLRRQPEARPAVLLFSNTQAGEYLQVAQAMGIPVGSGDAGAADGEVVLRLLADACRFLALPETKPQALFSRLLRAWAALRAAPWLDEAASRQWLAGVPLEALMYPAAGLPPARPAALAPADYALVLELAATLRRLLQARHLPPDELLPTVAQQLVPDPAAPALAARVVTIARRHVTAWDDPPLALAAELERLVQAGQGRDLGRPAGEVAPRRPGVLEVLTLHRSKGAEFDAVWLPALGFYSRAGTFFPWSLDHVTLRDQEGFEAEHALLHADDAEPPTLAQARLTAQRLLVAERLRLLYVGITRAERELHLSCHGGQAPPHILALAERCGRREP
ncbi:MAG: ATP-dependent helicase [Candidatus Sericytochromatia bacterium]|nr:ATP-dependent helicase [Candidatus Sericytochromatia bacterium]